MKQLLTIGAAAMLLMPLAGAAATYRFIISGDPVAAATENSRASASDGTSLLTGMRTVPAVPASLEARCRTWAESSGTSLRSDRKRGFIMIVK